MTEESKSRKPPNTAFRQQRLRAWQPLLTPKTVLPTFFIIGILFAPIGGLLLYSSDKVVEISIDYTNCYKQTDPQFVDLNESDYSINFPHSAAINIAKPRTKLADATAKDELTGVESAVKRCTIQFPVPVDMAPPVFMYYRMDGFYQNHRKYVKSYDSEQLRGTSRTRGQLAAGGCSDLAGPADSDSVYYPCGFIANSLFNDTLYNLTAVGGSADKYEFSSGTIAWPSDAARFGVPQYTDLTKVLPPPNWQSRFPDGKYSNATIQAIYNNQHFQVWMRTAGLPNFLKLWGKNDNQVLKAGVYSIDIDTRYNVTSFGGKKALVLSTVSFLGGRNPFLGIAYITVGVVCVLLGCIFTARHLYRPRKLGDHSYLSWNTQQPTEAPVSGGVASGPH